MKRYGNLFEQVYSLDNLEIAFKKARKGKTKRRYVIDFEASLRYNLCQLHRELKSQTYQTKPLKTFILRDPKTRKISKSDFRDRVVHHALCNVIEPIFEKYFIYDSYANRKGKGTLSALQRFDKFKRKIGPKGFILKADVKHYFDEVDHKILVSVIEKRIKDKQVLWLIQKILVGCPKQGGRFTKSMPLGNLTSQFFANVYLNDLDHFVKHTLRAKQYIRYVDDFVILHKSCEQLEKWRTDINKFLETKLKLELHPHKSRIISLSRGIDFVGFRNFYYFRLLRKRNIRKMKSKINWYLKGEVSKKQIEDSFHGWCAYAKWADTFKLRNELSKF